MSSNRDYRAFQIYALLSLTSLFMYFKPNFVVELLTTNNLTSVISGIPYLAFIMIGFLGKKT